MGNLGGWECGFGMGKLKVGRWIVHYDCRNKE